MERLHPDQGRTERERPPLPVRVLAIGSGALHRALPHELIDQLNTLGLYNGGIFVGQPRGRDTANGYNQLEDGYPVVTFTSAGIQAIKTVRSVVGAVSLADEQERQTFYSQAKNDLDAILVGVTEAGFEGEQPWMDVLFETLRAYHEHHGETSSISVINTDNKRGNGDLIKEMMVRRLPQTQNSSFGEWLFENVDFHNTMVDRIVPKPTAIPTVVREDARRHIGTVEGSAQDVLTTFAEPMPRDWAFVIEDPKRRLRIPFDKLPSPQVIVSKEPIDRYHEWKLRLENAIHVPALTAAIALLFGSHGRIDEALRSEPLLRQHAEKFAEAVAATVAHDAPIPDMDPKAYALSFVDRVANLPDDAARINITLGEKLRLRVAPSILSGGYHALSDAARDRIAISVAAVLRFLSPVNASYQGKDETGALYEIDLSNAGASDLLRGILGTEDYLMKARSAVDEFCKRFFWGVDEQGSVVTENRDFRNRLMFFYSFLLSPKTNLLATLAQLP